MDKPREVISRNAKYSDVDQVQKLLEFFKLGVSSDPEKIRAKWNGVWVENPALKLDLPPPSLGYVLESEGKLVGIVANIPRLYQFGDQTLLVSCARSWAVYKEFRAYTKEITGAYFKQKDVNLLLTNTLNVLAERVYIKNSINRVPQPDLNQILFWILDAAGFIGAVLKKKEIFPSLATPIGLVMSPFLKCALSIKSRRLGSLVPGIEPEEIPLQAIGDEFDDLWYRKINKERRLFAFRTAETIRWVFNLSAIMYKVIILRCRRQGRLAGYIALLLDEVSEFGLKRLKIADLFVESNDTAVIEALFAAAYEYAEEQHCQVLELVGLPREIRTLAKRSRPFVRLSPSFQWYYTPVLPKLKPILQNENAWYPSLYDADAIL